MHLNRTNDMLFPSVFSFFVIKIAEVISIVHVAPHGSYEAALQWSLVIIFREYYLTRK